jgi:hypothetical protein
MAGASWFGREEASFDDATWFLIPIAFVLVELRHAIGFDDGKLAAALRRTNLGWVGIAVLLLAWPRAGCARCYGTRVRGAPSAR